MGISDIWSRRFHQEAGRTKNWVFYISRPTLELLRKPGSEGRNAYHAVKMAVEAFLDKQPDANAFNVSNSFSINTSTFDVEHTEMYCTLSFPFDIRDEITNKLGVVIHAAEANQTEGKEVKLSHVDNFPSMFDKEFTERLRKELVKLPNNTTENHPNNTTGKTPHPPGVQDADPMWFEYASSKMLPTDQLLAKDIEFGKFRNIVAHQYIEIRLHKTRSKDKSSSREQLDALQRFESFSSGLTNFSGPPGTGKSTLLHMVCAHRLFQNFREQLEEGMNKVPDKERTRKTTILYYLHSQTLRDEAIREVKSILNEVYLPLYPNELKDEFRRQLDDVIDEGIFYINQEELISSNITPNPDRNILSDNSKKELEKQKFLKNRPAPLPIIRRGLRNIVFGMFGNYDKYNQWVREVGDWEKHAVNFHRPNSGRIAQNHTLVMKDFLPDEPNSPIKKQREEFDKHVKKLSEENLLWDGTSDEQFWDPSCLFYLSSKEFELQGKNSYWQKLEHRVDWIVIDEVQDTSLLEIRILLDHFSNRKNGHPYRDFRLIIAGDENQNVNHLLYQPQNRHIEYTYQNWVQRLKETGERTLESYRLSQHLTDEISVLLKSGYRVFDEMLPFANDILKSLREHHAKTNQKRQKEAKLTETNYGRNGVFVRLNNNLNSTQKGYLDKWQEQMLTQLEKQMLTTVDEEQAFEPDSSEPIRVAFTYDSVDFDNDYKTDESPFTKRLKIDGSYINDFAEKVDELMKAFAKKFETWYANDNTNNKNSMVGEMAQALQLRGVMDVSSIKGLTMPVCLILPSSRLTKGAKQETMEDLSKFLVQITRAQYFNIIIEDTRSFGEQLTDKAIVMSHEWPIENVGEWLEAVLNHSAGFDHTFNRIFHSTMNRYDSKLLWTRLKKDSEGIDENLSILVDWLHDLLWAFKHDDDWDPFEWEKDHLDLENNKPTGIKTSRSKPLELEACRDLETDYMLGESRFTPRDLSSLRLFLVINKFLCTRVANTDGSTGKCERVSSQKMFKSIKQWVDQYDEDDSLTGQKTADWLKLFANPKHDDCNVICQAIKSTFNRESPQWPQEPQPRLNMGGWRIRNTNKAQEGEAEKNDLGRYAWMEDESAFFNIRPEALEWSLVELKDEDEGYLYKMRLFLGMTSLNVAMTTNVLIEVLSSYDEEKDKEILDWFVDVFTQEASDTGKKYTSFKREMRESLEAAVKDITSCQEALTTYLSQAENISDFRKTLDAFGFEDWKSCIRGKDMFQGVVDMAYQSVMPVLRLMNCHENLHKITTQSKPDAIQNERNKKKRYEVEVNGRSEYFDNNREAILVDLGVIQKELEYSFEKGRARSKTDSIAYDETEIIEIINKTDLEQTGPIRTTGNSANIKRSGIQKWREYLKPYNERVEKAEQSLRRAERTKANIEKESRDAIERKRQLLENLKNSTVLLGADDYSTLSNEKLPFRDAHEIYKKYLENPFMRKGDSNQMFSFFNSQLQSDGKQKEHRHWFNLVWGLDAMLRGSYSGEDFQKFPVKFPSTKGEFVGKIHALVDAYCEVNPDSISRLNDSIRQGLRPNPKGDKTDLIKGFTDLMQSLKEAYSNTSRKELAYLKDLHPDERLDKSETLHDKIYAGFMKNHSEDVQIEFLSYLTNYSKEGHDCVMSQEETWAYLTSSQARLVFATLTGEFLPPISEEDMLEKWTELTYKKKQKSRFLDDRDDFKDMVFLNALHENTTTPDKNKPPLRHSIWFAAEDRSRKIPSQYNNAATYRAFAHLAMGQHDEAASNFDSCGLHNHAAALMLAKAAGDGREDRRYEMLTTVQGLCAREVELYQTSLYADHIRVSSEREKFNSPYRYGIGPPSERMYKARTDDGIHSISRFVSIAQKLDLKLGFDPSTKKDADERMMLKFMEHAHRIEHAEIYRDGLKTIEEESDSPDEYMKKFNRFMAAHGDRFTMYRDDVTEEKDAYGIEELKDNRNKFRWKWNAQPEKKGVVRKAGFQPKEERDSFKGKNVLKKFILEFLDRKNILNRETLIIRVEEITGVSGATLGYLNPSRCKIEFADAKKEVDIQDKLAEKVMELDRVLSKFETEKVYAGNKSALRTLRNARRDLRDEAFEDVLDNIEADDGLYINDREEILNDIQTLMDTVEMRKS